MSQQQKDKRAASAVPQHQALQHSNGGTSRVRFKSELESAVEAHFLYGEGERLFTTQDPTGVEGAAHVIKDKNLIIKQSANHKDLATSDISALTEIIMKSAGNNTLKVPERVVAAWVAFYTLPKKRTALAKILQACITYPSNPQVDVSVSNIKFCSIFSSASPTASQQPQHQSWIRSFFTSNKQAQNETAVPADQGRPPIGMRCEETIKFQVKDVDNSAPVEDVVMTIRYDLIAVRNKSSGTDDVELRNLSFLVTAAEEFNELDGNSNKCVWNAKRCCTRVFLSTELDLIKTASKLEAVGTTGNSAIPSNGSPQASLTYKQRLQALLDKQEMAKRAGETRARISSQSNHGSIQEKQILFKNTEFLKNNADVCKRIFVSSYNGAEEMLSAFVHTVIADSCADKQNTKPEYFQKISFKIPLSSKDAQEEGYKVIEHGSVHIPLSGQNIHALLSYIVTKKRATDSDHKAEVVISKAKLGVRHVRGGFKLHNCSWAHYRSTDFITFVIPDLTHTCVTSTLPTCWHQAIDYRALISPHPKNTAGMTSKQEGTALAGYSTAVPVARPGRGASQKSWTTGVSEKKSGIQSETKGDLGKHGTDYAASWSVDVHDTTNFAESGEPEHQPNMAHLQWLNQMVAQASTYCADMDEHSFELHVAGFTEAHQQPNSDSHTRRSGEAFDYDTPQGSFGFNNVEELEPQSEPESGRHPTKETHGGGRSKVKKPLPHSEGKPQSQLLWLLSAIWKSILLILQFLIVTPLVYIYKLCTQCATQSPTTDAPEEASDKSAEKSVEKQKESTSLFTQLRQRVKNSSSATNNTDAATPRPKKQEKYNDQTSNTVPINTKSGTDTEEQTPSDKEAEVPSTLQESKIENAFFEDQSVIYPT